MKNWNILTLSIDWGFVVIPSLVGLVFILIERRKFVERKTIGIRENTTFERMLLREKDNSVNILSIVVGVICVSWGVFNFFSESMDLYYRQKEMRGNTTKVAEGIVKEVFVQPASGHSKGDIVEVEGKKFEINYFLSTYYYHQSISHGGILKNGAKVRILYLPSRGDEEMWFGDGKIVSIQAE